MSNIPNSLFNRSKKQNSNKPSNKNVENLFKHGIGGVQTKRVDNPTKLDFHQGTLIISENINMGGHEGVAGIRKNSDTFDE
jgi:hypothetical protein